MAIVFDTLAYARRMESVGFSREQAEALAEEQSKLIDERLATKQDLELLKQDLIIKLGTIITVSVGLFSAITHFWK